MASNMRVTWGPGLQLLMKRMADRPQIMVKAIASAAYMEGEETISASKPLVPVLNGFLVNSGFCQLPNIEGTKVSVKFGFGGVAGSGNQGATNSKDVGYAVPVHENLVKKHPHGQAKFLEQPLNERESSMSDRMAGRIKAQLP